MDPIRVLLCNQHPIIRSGWRVLLENEPEIRVIGEAANGPEAVALADYWQPDIVLLDIKLAHTTGILVAREIAAKAKHVGVVFVSAHSDEEYVSEAFRAGGRGYVLADSAQTDLIRAIRAVTKGSRFLSPSITSELLSEYARRNRSANDPPSESERKLFCLLEEIQAFCNSRRD
jgi:DNA-binding NarL/FixJ family response regulator